MSVALTRPVLVICSLVIAAALLRVVTTQAVRADGVAWFSADQVNAGRLAYTQNCAVCHGAQLKGGGAPVLIGPDFTKRWNGKTVQTFYSYVSQNMPLGKAGSLKPQQYADVVAYILANNGLPAGTQVFTPDSPMGRVLVLSAAASSTTPSTAGEPSVTIGKLYGQVREPSTTSPTQAELDAADASTNAWLMYNKGYRGERYSSLDTINVDNASALHPVCMFQLGELGTFSTGPVMYDGMLYVTTHLGTYAIDATTCKKLWSQQHVAQGPEMNATNKGVAIAGGRVIRGTQDGFLYALDAKTGALLWERQVTDWRVGEGVGAAPIVWHDLVFVGKAGADWGIRGQMFAFHAADGSLAWSFDFIPVGNQAGASTWKKPNSREHGGGASWVTYALDSESGTLFVPVGNPGPDFNSDVRPGANLFTNSVVALDARTGKLKWWYQLRPNDFHDYDTTDVSLFDDNGKKLLATAGKAGVLHVLDRDSGKLVFKLPVTTLLNQDVPLTSRGVRVCPVAGVQWNGAAHSPKTGLLYVNAIDWCTTFRSGPDPKWIPTVPYTGLTNGFGTNDPVSRWSGWINAIDPTTGKMVWRLKRPTPMYAALTPTGGNVVFTGDLNGDFLALDARDGKTLYTFNTGGPIAGGIITYERGGKQYVAVASGNSGGSIPLTGSATVVIFGL